MPQPQLSVRSARARTLARRLAKKERRSIAQVVERALESYEKQEHGREPEPKKETGREFWDRIARDYGVDIDLDAIIRKDRVDHSGPDL
jgi:hypothetical protein